MTDYDAAIVIAQDEADEAEYPTCHRCGAPIVHFMHTRGIGFIRTCSDPECYDGLENFCARQIAGTTVQHCIDAVGVDALRDQVTAKLEMLNDHREENGLDPVETPAEA